MRGFEFCQSTRGIVSVFYGAEFLSNEQIAHELSINESDAYQMTTALRDGMVKKSQP